MKINKNKQEQRLFDLFEQSENFYHTGDPSYDEINTLAEYCLIISENILDQDKFEAMSIKTFANYAFWIGRFKEACFFLRKIESAHLLGDQTSFAADFVLFHLFALIYDSKLPREKVFFAKKIVSVPQSLLLGTTPKQLLAAQLLHHLNFSEVEDIIKPWLPKESSELIADYLKENQTNKDMLKLKLAPTQWKQFHNLPNWNQFIDSL